MGRPITVVKGIETLIDPRTQYADSGWEISGRYATHYACYPGYMEYVPPFPFVDGVSYDITYLIDNYTSGVVRLDIGGNIGTPHSGNGEFTDVVPYEAGATLRFYSDGALRVKSLSVAQHTGVDVLNAETFGFNEVSRKWVSNYPYFPDLMLKFSNRFFSFKNGQLWEHDTNALRGNFYGVQYPALITFVVNVDFRKDKMYFNMRLDAKGKWYVPTMYTVPSNQFPRGMRSRLKKGNVKQIDGKLWADILRDLNDPNFVGKPESQALFNGRMMQGGWLVVQLRCDDTTEATISSIETYYTETSRSF